MNSHIAGPEGPKEGAVKEGEILDSIVGRLEQVLMEAGVAKRQIRTKMASICGITPQAIAHWFSGSTSVPGAEHIAAIAAYYEVDLMWVITGDPNGPTRVQGLLRNLALKKKKAAKQKMKIPKAQKMKIPKAAKKKNRKSKPRSLTLVVS